MGNLVKLPKRGRTEKTRSDTAGPGQVVLFTGIRYERDGAPDKPAGAAPTNNTRRRG